MKLPKRLSWIRILMIFSQLVLTGFVLQWLFSQYNSERDILKKELSLQFMEAQEEVMDSMLVIHLIDPIMQGKETYTVQMEISGDTLECLEQGAVISQDTAQIRMLKGKRTMIAMGSSDSLPVNKANIFATAPLSGEIDDIMLQSVRLIVQRAADTLHPDSGFTRILTSMLDTGLLKRSFDEKVHRVGENLITTWHDSITMDEVDSGRIPIFFACAITEQGCGVQVENFFWYLARKTIPAFLFGIVLLLLTGASFIIAFRTLKNQMVLNRMRNSFVSNISHELKTPVSTVKVALEALRGADLKNDPETAAGYLEMAEKELNRLDLLISQVLNASLYNNGVKIIETESIDLKELVSEVLELLRPRFEKEHATVTFEAGKEAYIVPVDRLHVIGVLLNLLDNSMKYCHERANIMLDLNRSGREVILVVSDHGVGIPEEFLSRIFDKFFRVPLGDSHNIKGYGLGLSYAAMVMEQHRGTIRAQNRPDGGVIFTLSFPDQQR